MADYKYVKQQEKNIEKKYTELMDECKSMMHEGELMRIKKKYNQLQERKKSGKLDWADEMMLEIYRDAIKIEEHEM